MRTAIITGGTGGLGAAVTRRFLDDGWRVVVPVGRTSASWSASSAATGSSSCRPTCSIRTRPRAVARRRRRRRRAPSSTSSAASHAGGRVHESPVADLRPSCALNLEPAWLVTGAALPAMLAAGEGAVVCVSSRTALQPFSGGAAYAVAKARGARVRRRARTSSTSRTASARTRSCRRSSTRPPTAPRCRTPTPPTWVTAEQIAATIAVAVRARQPRRRAARTSPSTDRPERWRSRSRPTPDPRRSCAAGSTSAARRSRRSSSTTGTRCSGAAARRRRARAGRRPSSTRSSRRWTAALEDAGAQAGELAGIGVGTPGAVDTGERHRRQRAQPAGLDRPVPARAAALAARSRTCPSRLGNDVNVAIAGEYAARRGPRARLDPRRLVGHRRRRRARAATARCGTGAATPASSATRSSGAAATSAAAATAAASRPTPGAR